MIPIDEKAKSLGLVILLGSIDPRGLSEDEAVWWETIGTTYVIGYWDFIDEAWAVTTHPWYGPFFIPTHYSEIPKELL